MEFNHSSRTSPQDVREQGQGLSPESGLPEGIAALQFYHPLLQPSADTRTLQEMQSTSSVLQNIQADLQRSLWAEKHDLRQRMVQDCPGDVTRTCSQQRLQLLLVIRLQAW